mmetsp:Transcript_84262/g.238765  ORF Transcript_84262/g.238765 Transcript_84262/m.238765 type:complete len:322 (-) Transcript_84262:508-1473(-)
MPPACICCMPRKAFIACICWNIATIAGVGLVALGDVGMVAPARAEELGEDDAGAVLAAAALNTDPTCSWPTVSPAPPARAAGRGSGAPPGPSPGGLSGSDGLCSAPSSPSAGAFWPQAGAASLAAVGWALPSRVLAGAFLPHARIRSPCSSSLSSYLCFCTFESATIWRNFSRETPSKQSICSKSFTATQPPSPCVSPKVLAPYSRRSIQDSFFDKSTRSWSSCFNEDKKLNTSRSCSSASCAASPPPRGAVAPTPAFSLQDQRTNPTPSAPLPTMMVLPLSIVRNFRSSRIRCRGPHPRTSVTLATQRCGQARSATSWRQ